MHDLAQIVTGWDRAAFLAMNHGLKCRLLDGLMPAVTDLGLGWVQALVVLGIAVYAARRAGEVRGRTLFADLAAAIYRRRAWVGPLLVCFAVSGLSADLVKILPRERPWWFYARQHRAGRFLDVQVLTVRGVYPLKVRGFPSGHTATTVAMATVVTLLFARRRGRRALVAGAWVVAALVALSRIYLASHWPLDVLGGAALGVASGYAAMAACRRGALSRARKAANRDPGAGELQSLDARLTARGPE